jgi:hypothetical protein
MQDVVLGAVEEVVQADNIMAVAQHMFTNACRENRRRQLSACGDRIVVFIELL